MRCRAARSVPTSTVPVLVSLPPLLLHVPPRPPLLFPLHSGVERHYLSRHCSLFQAFSPAWQTQVFLSSLLLRGTQGHPRTTPTVSCPLRLLENPFFATESVPLPLFPPLPVRDDPGPLLFHLSFASPLPQDLGAPGTLADRRRPPKTRPRLKALLYHRPTCVAPPQCALAAMTLLGRLPSSPWFFGCRCHCT
jgi:hypothetical protein